MDKRWYNCEIGSRASFKGTCLLHCLLFFFSTLLLPQRYNKFADDKAIEPGENRVGFTVQKKIYKSSGNMPLE